MDDVVKTLIDKPLGALKRDVEKPTREEAEAAVRGLLRSGRRRPRSRGPARDAASGREGL